MGQAVGRPQREPLRSLTATERSALDALARAGSERAERVARAKALLAVADSASFTAAAQQAGRRSPVAVRGLVARFNREGIQAVAPGHGGGPPQVYGACGVHKSGLSGCGVRSCRTARCGPLAHALGA